MNEMRRRSKTFVDDRWKKGGKEDIQCVCYEGARIGLGRVMVRV